MFFAIIIFFANFAIFSNAQISCDKHPILSNLIISTSLSELSSDAFDIDILRNCEINPHWMKKQNSLPTCESTHRVFEGEDNIRRPLRFELAPSSAYKNDKIKIKSISLTFPHNIADTTLTKTSFDLHPGEHIDVYVQYDCLNMNTKLLVPAYWYKLIITVDIEVNNDNDSLSFEYYKICEAKYSGVFDISHFIIVVAVFAAIYVAHINTFHSTAERIIINKYNEMRNPENTIIIGVVLAIVIITLYIINLIYAWISICSFFAIILAIAMIGEAIHRHSSLYKDMSKVVHQISYVGEINNDNLLCIGIGLIGFFLWCITHNWIICDIIAIALSIIAIRIFKFTNSKMLIAIYIIIIAYDAYWTTHYAMYYSENYKLTNNIKQHFPIRLLCPEIVSTPFGTCNSLPISDIILPGIFLGYSQKFDSRMHISKASSTDSFLLSYYNVGLISIGVGFILHLMVYYFALLPTPTFLYTGTLLLIATIVLAYMNGHINEYIEGFKSTEYGDRLEENIAKIAVRNRGSPLKESNDVSVNDISGRSEQFYLNKEEYQPPKKESFEMKELKKK